jgi:glycosyltransferase involved in cell wall biosynthesis
MTGPTVSVVIPTYNYGRYVRDAIESALAQTVLPLEVVVVDDGSTDDTPAVLARYGDRIRVVRQENQGLSAARNTGIRAACGEWVAFLDSDDAFHPRKLELQLAALAGRRELHLVATDAFSDEPLRWPDVPDAPRVVPVSAGAIAVRTLFAPSSVLARKSCFDAVGDFDPALRSVEDRDMWVRVAARFPAAMIAAPLTWVRQTPGSMSRHPERMEQFDRIVIDRSFALPELRGRWALRRKATAHMLLSSAYTFLSAGRPGAAALRAAKALAAWPLPLPRNEVRVPFVRGRLLARSLVQMVTPARVAS